MKKKKAMILLIVYTLFLVWTVLLKWFPLGYISPTREVNLIPFYYKNVQEGDLPLFEALANLLVFVPFGYLLKRIGIKNGWCILIAMSLSLFFETMQYIFSIGSTDITDLITNTAGGAIGALIAYQLKRKASKFH